MKEFFLQLSFFPFLMTMITSAPIEGFIEDPRRVQLVQNGLTAPDAFPAHLIPDYVSPSSFSSTNAVNFAGYTSDEGIFSSHPFLGATLQPYLPSQSYYYPVQTFDHLLVHGANPAAPEFWAWSPAPVYPSHQLGVIVESYALPFSLGIPAQQDCFPASHSLRSRSPFLTNGPPLISPNVQMQQVVPRNQNRALIQSTSQNDPPEK